jgi:hypothetical protein
MSRTQSAPHLFPRKSPLCFPAKAIHFAFLNYLQLILPLDPGVRLHAQKMSQIIHILVHDPCFVGFTWLDRSRLLDQ